MAAAGPEEQILNQPDNLPDDVDTENQDEETAAMIEEPPSGMMMILMDNCWCCICVKPKSVNVGTF